MDSLYVRRSEGGLVWTCAEAEGGRGRGEGGRVERIFALHLPVEAIDTVHALALVVAPCQVEGGRVEALEGEQREDALHREGAPVHKVAVEKVRVLIRGEAVELEDVEEVVELRRQTQGSGSGKSLGYRFWA